MSPGGEVAPGADRGIERVGPAGGLAQDSPWRDRGDDGYRSIAPPEDLRSEVATRAARLLTDGAESVPGLPEDELTPLARSALEKLRSGNLPAADEVAALREVLAERRPGLWVRRRQVQPWPFGLTELGVGWAEIDLQVHVALGATGRIEFKGKPIATGFLVRSDLVVTNNHVVDLMNPSDGLLRDACIRFGVEKAGRLPRAADLTGVVARHPSLDLVLLRLRPGATRRKPVSLSSSTAKAQLPVVTIGYPFPDGDRAPAFANDIFGDNFGYQTVTPGRIVAVVRRGELEHDCATLGGNSGSPLIDLAEGKVVGIQAEGSFLSRNLAMPVSGVHDLLREAQV